MFDDDTFAGPEPFHSFVDLVLLCVAGIGLAVGVLVAGALGWI